MRNLKKAPTKQLEKFSTVFMQLGLVLTLFVVYVTLEYETVEKKVAVQPPLIDKGYVYTLDRAIIYKKEVVKPKTTQPKQKSVAKDLGKVKKVKNDDEVIQTVISNPTDNVPVLNPDTLPDDDEPEIIDSDDDPKSFSFIEEAPIFRGCEGLSKKENKKCFESKLRKHVQRHFNTDLAQDLGLRSGKHRISTQFVIDKQGKIIDVKIRAPHPNLKKEANRIVDKIPKFIPGKQQGEPVKVRYTLPILFQVE